MVAVCRLRWNVDGSLPQGTAARLGEVPPLLLSRPNWNPLAGHGSAVGRSIAARGRGRWGTLAIRCWAAVLLRWLLVWRLLSVALGWLSVGSVGLLWWWLAVGLPTVWALRRGRVLATILALRRVSCTRVWSASSHGRRRITGLLMAGSWKLVLTLAGILLAWIHSTILVLGGQALEIGGQFLEERHDGCGRFGTDVVGWRGCVVVMWGGFGCRRQVKRA